MFKKKKCRNCAEKIDGSYNFCPYCRTPIEELFDNEDWGMLGKNDSIQPGEIKLPMGLGALFNSLMKNLNNQFNEIERANAKPQKTGIKKSGISISISTSGNKPPEIKVRGIGNQGPEIREQKKIKPGFLKLPSMDSKKFSSLPKQEPVTNIRRLSEKVVYEINLPNVKSMKDVSIIQLENSIEIKALAKEKVFYKIIPINLPISNYNLSKGKLVLELDARE